MESDGASVLAILEDFNESAGKLLKKIRGVVDTEGIRKLAESTTKENHYEVFGIYYTLFDKLKCKSMPEVLNAFGKHQRKSGELQDAIEEFFDFETQWDDLLIELDEKLGESRPDSSSEQELVFKTLEDREISIKELCASGNKWTWIVFLRKFA